jgi:integrase/recombinase XerD
MSDATLSRTECLTRLSGHMKAERYSRSIVLSYAWLANRFLTYLERRHVCIETISHADVTTYLSNLRQVRNPHLRVSPPQKRQHQAAILMLLRRIHPNWPPRIAPCTQREIFHAEVIEGYDTMMNEIRGLADGTRKRCRAEVARFLNWLGDRADKDTLRSITISDIDAFIDWRSAVLRRITLAANIATVRGFLVYLENTDRLSSTLSILVELPKIYALEGIPSALRADEVQKVLNAARRDSAPQAKRDLAIVTLLTTYGLRGGEITKLKLEDIDWRNNVLRICHSKTFAHSELPLLPEPSEAVLDYLRHERPKTQRREVFLRIKAPFCRLTVTALHAVLSRYIKAARVKPLGKRGPHAFRHARAVSLLRNKVPLKVIGDVFGHRAPRSAMAYLKLATEDLRAIALDIPTGESR